MLRPIIRSRDIHGYKVPSPSTFCLLPYDNLGKPLNEDTLRREFPRAYGYLLAQKNRLTTGIRKRLPTWYGLTSATALRLTARTKIIGGLITSGGDMTIVVGTGLCHGGVLSITPATAVIDPYYLLGVCNSTIFWTFVQHQMPTMGIGRHVIRLERLRQFPLVVPCQENQESVQAIASGAQSLLADPVPLRRKEIITEIDRMVQELYRPNG
jgi:hypothetical protein